MDPHPANIVKLTARAPQVMESILNPIPDRVLEARSATTTTSDSAATTSATCGANACEKPVSNSTFTLPIILGIAIPAIGAAILFFILQRRHVRKQRQEDANDRHASMDFGLGDVPQPSRPKRGASPMPNKEYGEKSGNGMSQRQVSMDLSMNSPYLLPPELQNSRESIHSLSRNLPQNEDPYHPVTQYYPGDGASIRSQSKQGSSIYTGSSYAPSKMQDLSTAELIPNATEMPHSNAGFSLPPRQNSLPQNKVSSPVESLSNDPVPPYPVEPPAAYIPDSLPPPGIQRKGLPKSPHPGETGPKLLPTLPNMEDNRESDQSNGDASAIRNSNNYLGGFINSGAASTTPTSPPREQIPDPQPEPTPSPKRKSPPPALNSLPKNPRPPRKESIARVEPQSVQPQTYMEGNDYGDGFKVTPPSPGRATHEEQMRGQRYSMDVAPEEFAQAGLGAPGFDPKRLSMGFRPLPPDALTESDDPEVRANRIRSFYKEYFDESKPPPPGQYAPQGEYYEDYDENYLGETAYYDPDQNQFVMPYAQPVTRRAMTPPNRGPRFRGPPRGRQGSMGAMSTGGMSAGGMRGQLYPPGPYPQGPKAFSSASGRMGPGAQGPRRPMPPPAALNSLPTPSKLRDDSFALMGAIDFAPPQTFRDRVAGRSESPLGERRPYSPAVPSFAPTVSAFDELAPMPSPHMLRKSGTFTSLDFAPPKRFKDPENMSDAGSIRSNRSGISQVQLGAIRQGAYRVSRIPGDVVFTKDDLASQLKPQWGMRPHS